MNVRSTHADTTGASLDDLFQPRWQTYREFAASILSTEPSHPAAGVASMLINASHDVEQLLDEVERERARADAAEQSIKTITEDAGAVTAGLARERDAERARADQAEAALRGVEWPWCGEVGWGVCEVCHAIQKDGHKKGCIVGAALADTNLDESFCHFCGRVTRPWVTSDETWALVEPTLGQSQACVACFYDALPASLLGDPLVVSLPVARAALSAGSGGAS